MSPHFGIALGTLILSGLIDWRTRRIPNKLLTAALAAHLSTWIILGSIPKVSIISSTVYLLVVGYIISNEKLFHTLNRCIGMGDVKILGYWIAFISPYVAWNRLILSLSLLSILLVAVRSQMKRPEESLPFAPILLGGTILTFAPV